MPPNDDPTPAQRRLLRQQRRHEEASVRETLRLLRAARKDVRERIALLPEGSVTLTTQQMLEQALTEAITAYVGRFSELLGSEAATAADLGIAFAETTLPSAVTSVRFGLSREVIDGLHAYRLTLAGDVRDDALGQMREILQRGLLSGATTAELARDLGATGLQPVGPFRTVAQRSETIVRTELNRMANTATYHRYQAATEQVPGLRKRWLATADLRTRDSHRALNGVERAMDEDFTVGSSKAAYPHDPRLPARESVSCRCRLVPVLPEE